MNECKQCTIYNIKKRSLQMLCEEVNLIFYFLDVMDTHNVFGEKHLM